MGRRKREQQGLWVATCDLPQSPGNPFYSKLNSLLDEAGFDQWVEDLCRPHDFFLRACHGNTRIKIVPPARVRGRGGRRIRHWVTEDKHKLFMRILCATKIDGTKRVRIVRPAVRSNRENTLPIIIDASKLPIDRP